MPDYNENMALRYVMLKNFKAQAQRVTSSYYCQNYQKIMYFLENG